MQADLQRLGTLIEGWSQADEIPAVERDLALEKLRNLYEAIRFADSASESSAAVPTVESTAAPETAPELPEEEFPESLDLGAVLSLDGFPDLAETEGPIYAEPADPFGAGGLESGDAETASEPTTVAEPDKGSELAPEQDVPAEEPEANPETESETVQAPAAEEPEAPAVEPVAETEPVAEMTPTVEPAPTPAPEPEAIPETEPETVPAEPETVEASTVEEPEVPAGEPAEAPVEPEVPVAEPVEAPVAEPEVTLAEEPKPEETPAAPEKAAETESEPTVTLDPLPAPETSAHKSHHASPTLFGEEDEEAVRHRHKQRVIMSLYGPSPAPERTPVSPRHAVPKPVSHAAETAPAGQPFEVIDITEAPESFVGTSDAPTSAQTARSAETTDPHPAAAEPAAAEPFAAGIHPDTRPATELESAPKSVPAAEPASGSESVLTTPAATPDTDSEASDDEAWLSEETISVVDGVEESAPETRDAAYQGTEPHESRTAGAEPSDETSAEPHAAGAASADLHSVAESRTAASAPTPNGGSIPTSGAVLGEVINHNVQTLADTIAPPRDIASELLRSEPVTDLRRAIGLNDKFLLIRDLFDGDSEAFARAIDTLNGFDNLDDCMIFIAEHYAWNPNSDGAKLMMDLLERKFA